MEGQNIKKIYQKRTQLDMQNRSENKKLYYAFTCDKMTPTEAEKIKYAKMSKLSTLEDETKPNTFRFSIMFLYYNGLH